MSCHDHFSASSPSTVSALSCGLRESNSTRLLKHGMAGHVVETVDVSWIAKPCGVSSRWASVSTPPLRGVGDAGGF